MWTGNDESWLGGLRIKGSLFWRGSWKALSAVPHWRVPIYETA